MIRGRCDQHPLIQETITICSRLMAHKVHKMQEVRGDTRKEVGEGVGEIQRAEEEVQIYLLYITHMHASPGT